MAGTKKERRKGIFGEVRLPKAKSYVFPDRRRWLTRIALAVGLAGIGWMTFLLAVSGERWMARGPLSSSHASFEADCDSCHDAFESASSENCVVCHERVGDSQGRYSFRAHYVYRSTRNENAGHRDRESECAACHVEHRGRSATISEAADAFCLGCHDFGSFNGRHPEFEFAREGVADDPNLSFPHRLHVKEVTKAQGSVDVQRTCGYCHVPENDGRGFEPIEFDRACDACHLTARTSTPRLAIKQGSDPVGVETLSEIQTRSGPGTLWSYYINPKEFREVGGKVSKRPVHHEDPWVLENLRRIRRTLYPSLGLAELLTTALDSDVRSVDGQAVYSEAITTLREHAAGLRGRSETEVQEELQRIEGLLDLAESKLQQPGQPLPDLAPFLPPAEIDPSLDPDTVAGLKQLALELTEPCRRCHVVSNAAILRVQKDQAVLDRAEFSHRAHVLQRPFCLDCHGEIAGLEDPASYPEPAEPDDLAEVQNLPRIDSCRECHDQQAVSNRCTTCHAFHPGRGREVNPSAFRFQAAVSEP